MLNRLIISLLNKVLDANSGIQAKLSQFHGKVIGVEFIGLNLILQISSKGSLSLVKTNADATIKIPLNISNYLISLDRLDLARTIKFEGDKDLAFNFLSLITSLHLNVLYGKNSVLDQILLKSEAISRLIKQQVVTKFSDSLNSSIEYLQYESHVLMTPKQLKNFHYEVYELNSKVGRIQAKLDLYSQLINNQST